MKIGVDDSEVERVESSIGVRQGSCEGLIVFLFIMQAAIKTLTWPAAKPVFRTCSCVNFPKRHASSFDLWASTFADDRAIFFNCHADLELGASYLFNHLRRFGLLMHTDVGTTLSDTLARYLPPPRVGYSNADTSRFDIRNADGSTVGFVDFTEEFKYIGSIIDSSLTSGE